MPDNELESLHKDFSRHVELEIVLQKSGSYWYQVSQSVNR